MIGIKLHGNNFKEFSKMRIQSIEKNIIDSLSESMETWKKKALKVTPKKTGQLRSSAKYVVKDGAVTGRVHGWITFVGWDKEERVNYALVRHEIEARRYTTPGTKHKYISETVENNSNLFIRKLRKAEKEQNK